MPKNSAWIHRRAKIDAFMFLGGKCEICGENDMRVLNLDHTKGNGCRERDEMGTYAIYRRVLRCPEDYQLLCANHHAIKNWEGKYYQDNSNLLVLGAF